MNNFKYINNELYAENVAVSEISEQTGTPVYIYSQAEFSNNFNGIKNAFDKVIPDQKLTICYASKANSHLAILGLLGKLGAGADTVSMGEIKRAVTAGISPDKIVFSGVGKTVEEHEFALNTDILQINLESLPEAISLNDTAGRLGKTARVAIRINPDVDAKTHAKITTGKKENKFGIDLDVLPEICEKIAELPNLDLVGLAMHIGSQLTTLEPFENAFKVMAQTVETLREKGHNIRTIDLGGGLGITYLDEVLPSYESYAELVRDIITPLGCHVILEPGRSIAGNAGILVSKTIYIKQGGSKTFLIVDAAMNDLARPSLYDAYHHILPVQQKDVDETTYDIVGPVCETGDTFLKNHNLPTMEQGEDIALMSAGAYGSVMASNYNTRNRLPEVLVNGDKFTIITPRQELDDQFKDEIVPNWV